MTNDNLKKRNSIKLKFLGSGSGDFYIMRLRKDISNNSYPTQLLICQSCLIDFSSESVYLLNKYNISFEKINNIFITHSQLDHFHAPTICYFALERNKYTKIPIRVWGTEIVRYMLEQEILLSNTADFIRINTLTPLHKYHLDNINVIPLPANHLKGGYFSRIGEVSLNYIIKIGSENILYAVDTGYPENEIWDIWNQYKFKVVILEATLGDLKEDQSLGHLNFEQSIEIIKQLRANGKIENNGQVILTHLNQSHILEERKTKKRLEKIGIRLAYDGMQISL